MYSWCYSKRRRLGSKQLVTAPYWRFSYVITCFSAAPCPRELAAPGPIANRPLLSGQPLLHFQSFVLNAPEVTGIIGRPALGDEPFELRVVDESLVQGDFLKASDLESLPLFQRLDEQRRGEQRVKGPRVQPSHAAPQRRHRQLAGLHVVPIQIGDLQLAAIGRLQSPGD